MNKPNARTVTLTRIGIIGFGILLTMLPVTMLVPVLKELVGVRFQVSPFFTHLFMSTSLIGAIVFSPLSGILIDRIRDRRKVLLLALAGNGICFVGMAVAPSFGLLLTARFLEGVFHITALSGWMAAGADVSPRGKSGRIMGALGGMIMLGITIGVPLGGIIARGETLNVLWVASIISLVAGIISLLLKLPPREFQAAPHWLDSLVILKNNPWLSIPYIYTFIDRLSVGVIVTTFTLYLADMLHLEPAKRGATLTFFLLPFSLLTYPAGRLSDRFGKLLPMAGGSLLFGVAFMSYGYLNGNHLLGVMVLSGILSAAMFTPTLALCKDLSTPEQHGIIFVGYNVAGSLGFIVGPIVGGLLFTWFNALHPTLTAYRMTFIITGTLEIACALLTLPFLIKLHQAGFSRFEEQRAGNGKNWELDS